MGIDPVTHKPLSNATEQTQNQPKQQLHQPLEEEQQNQPPLQVDFDLKLEHEKTYQNKEPENPETSFESSTITEAKEEDTIIMTPLIDTIELMNNDGFCTDEVPIIEPDEILVPCAPSSSSISTSSSSSSSSSSNNFLEDLQLLDFEWSCNYNDNGNIINNNIDDDNNNNSVDLWDDDFISSLSLLINDDDGDSKQVLDASLCQNPRMVMDSESWAYGLL